MYLALYAALVQFKKDFDDGLELKENIAKIVDLKKGLDSTGLSAFLTPEIEIRLTYFLDFLTDSLNNNELRYGTISSYRFMGVERLEKSKFNGKNTFFVHLWAIYLNTLARFRLFKSLGFENVDIKLIKLSAPIKSKEFEYEVSSNIESLKGEIKSIALGTK